LAARKLREGIYTKEEKEKRLSSDILRACSLASSKKEHFQEEKEGHPLSFK
jgi:hypothetical protein